MVNLEKWEEVEHEDVKLGDNLKIVWTITSPTLKTKEVHKGNVRNVAGNGDFWLNSTCWEPGDPDEGTTTTVYRRKVKAKPFKLPTEFGAIISGVHYSSDKREWLVFDGRDWCAGMACYDPDDVLESFVGHILEREGIVRPGV